MVSRLEIAADDPFGIENIPFGIYVDKDGVGRVCTAIGQHVVDLYQMAMRGFFDGPLLRPHALRVFAKPELNEFMALGRSVWREARLAIQEFLKNTAALSSLAEADFQSIFVERRSATMQLPFQIGDYTDFYASKEHATNVGTMFRGKENALMPNWLHLPVGYHGRASSIVVSGTDIKRPCGQIKGNESTPRFGRTEKLDFELEMAFVIGVGNRLGSPVDIREADEHIFGVVIMNDWSARDIQSWEYVPLGPFLGKSFGTTISPWVVTLDALKMCETEGCMQEPKPLPYLQDPSGKGSYDVELEVRIRPARSDQDVVVCKSNLKYMYWSFRQQLAHHTINGCNMRTGDLCGTGTISGPTRESYGSLLELSWNGTTPLRLGEGIERTFLEDGDCVIMAAYGGSERKIGFGECVGKIVPAQT